MESNDLVWSGQSWRLPLWFWLSLAAMAVSTMHILLDFGVGLFPLRGRLAPAVGAVLVLISLIHAWWGVSLAAGAQGNGGGVASAAILGLGWTLLTNGYPIVFCPPPCSVAAPLTDVAHVGSIVLGIAAPAAGIWSLWRRRVRVGWALPAGALVLVVATILALSRGADDSEVGDPAQSSVHLRSPWQGLVTAHTPDTTTVSIGKPGARPHRTRRIWPLRPVARSCTTRRRHHQRAAPQFRVFQHADTGCEGDCTMTPEEMKSRARRIADELFSQGDLAVADEILALDLIHHTPETHVEGSEGAKQFVMSLRHAFPDLSATVDDQIAEGDKVVQRIRWSGTHEGEFFGVPSTGKRVTAELVEIHRFGPDGKIAEHWSSMDQLGVLQQLGAIPA